MFVGRGFVLIGGARAGGPARALGPVFVLFGSIFADPLIAFAAPPLPEFSRGLRVLHATLPVALSPAFFWRFAWAFPRAQPGLMPPALAAAIRNITYASGVILFVVLLVHDAIAPAAPPSDWSKNIVRDVMWVSLVILEIPTFLLLLAKVHTALPEERRRLRVFIGGIVIAMAPLLLDVLAGAFIPPFRTYEHDPAHRRLIAQITAAALLFLPAATGYAVLVDR